MNNNTKQTIATFDAVAAACEAIEADGGRVSVRAVMAHLGGGSPNAVTKHLRDWREKKPLIEARKAITIDPRLNNLIAELIERAATDARSDADAERIAAVEDYELLATTGRQLEQIAEQQAEQLAAASEREQHDAGVIEQLRADAEKIRADAAAAIAAAKAEAAEVAAKALAEAQAERAKNDDLGRHLGASQTRGDALAAKVDELMKQVAELSAKLDAEREARVSADKALAVAEANVKALETRVADGAKALEAAEKKVIEAESALAVERTARAAAETAAAKAQAQADERAKLIDALTATIEAERTKSADLAKQLDAAQNTKATK